jgi:hypothetical protein
LLGLPESPKGVAIVRRPWTITANRILILVNIFIWLGLGIIIATNRHPALPIPSAMKAIMAIMSFAMAGILTTLFILLLRGNRGAFYLLLGFFGLTSLLTIFDDVGLSDIVVLILNILPVVLLVWDRRWYLWDNNPSQTSKVSDEL